VFQVAKPRTWQGALRGQRQIKGDLFGIGLEWETSQTGTVSRRGAGAQGRRDVVPVALVVADPTFIPSRPRGFARRREDAKGWAGGGQSCRSHLIYN